MRIPSANLKNPNILTIDVDQICCSLNCYVQSIQYGKGSSRAGKYRVVR